ncbi:hypothetical protein HDU76_012434 [Blyttiomyces sp. JEL0837]|nr:hypothetical protein HDU76_012434 [Blyttiomyces sp. JEL0837]
MSNPIQFMKWKMERIDNSRHIYEDCALQFHDGNKFMSKYNLPDNFQTWFTITVLHIWMYNTKLRAEGADGKDMKQEIFNTLWLDVELRLSKAGVKMNLGKIVSDLLSSFYGQTLAYDEGLYYGDAVLAAALWRNVFAAKDVSAEQLEELVTYVRRQLQHIDSSEVANAKEPPKFLEL